MGSRLAQLARANQASPASPPGGGLAGAGAGGGGEPGVAGGLAGVAAAGAAGGAPEPAEERCGLCGAPVDPVHRHAVDVASRRLLCACRACTLLLDQPGAGTGADLRLVPTRRRRLAPDAVDDAAWARLRLPVELAFFFFSSAAGRVVALYPSPMGATESLLELSAWAELAAGQQALAGLEPDVEALLVSRARGMREHWIVPVDDCYELVALIRVGWKGFGGGDDVWRAISDFFDDLAKREERRW